MYFGDVFVIPLDSKYANFTETIWIPLSVGVTFTVVHFYAPGGAIFDGIQTKLLRTIRRMKDLKKFYEFNCFLLCADNIFIK